MIDAAARNVLVNLTHMRVVESREPRSDDDGQPLDRNAWHRWHTEYKLAHRGWSEAVTRLAAAVLGDPRVEIVTYRDPDGPTYLYLFLDGVSADHAAEWTDIDPGAGHMLDEWRHSRDLAVNSASHDAAERIQELYDAGEITGHVEPDGYRDPHDDAGVS